MAAIPYPSTSGRHGVPTLNIPFRAIISSSSSGSNNRSPSPSALGSFGNPFASSSSPSSSSPAPTSPPAAALASSPFSSNPSAATSAAPSPSSVSHHDRHRHHQSESSIAYNPQSFSSGRRSRRAARGPEVAPGGRRTGGRDIDDMTDEELRAHVARRARLDSTIEGEEGTDDLEYFRQRSGLMGAGGTDVNTAGGRILQQPMSSRSSTSSELPAYFVDPSLPQYEYRARPVWYGGTAGLDESNAPGQGSAVPAWVRAPVPTLGNDGVALSGSTSSVTPSATFCVIPSTPERRILNLPNRNSPPVPPRSLPNTSGLSVLRGSSLSSSVNSNLTMPTVGAPVSTSAAAAASMTTAVPLTSAAPGASASEQSPTRAELAAGADTVSPAVGVVVASSHASALPPPAYEEQDSSRHPSEAWNPPTASGLTRNHSADSAGTAPTAFPITDDGQSSVPGPVLWGNNGPSVPTRSVSLSNASIPTALRERVNMRAAVGGGSNSHSRDSSVGVIGSIGEQDVTDEAVGRSMSWTASSAQEISTSQSACRNPVTDTMVPTVPPASIRTHPDEHREELREEEEGEQPDESESDDPSIVVVERGGPSHPAASKRKRWSQLLMMPLTAASLSSSSWPVPTSPLTGGPRGGGGANEGSSPNPVSPGSSSSSSFFKALLTPSPSPGDGSSTLRPNAVAAVGRSSSNGSASGTATPPAGSGSPSSPSPPCTPGNSQGRRPLSMVSNSPSSSTIFNPGSAWGMIGIGLGYAVNPTFSFAGGSVNGGNTNGNGGHPSQASSRCYNTNQTEPLRMMGPPVPSERRSSRAVGRHMRAATTLLPGSGNSGQHPQIVGAQSGTNLTFPRRGASRTAATTPFNYDSTEASPAGPAPGSTPTAAAAAVLGLSAREWALRLAWAGEGGPESEAASTGPGSGTERERRSHSVSAM